MLFYTSIRGYLGHIPLKRGYYQALLASFILEIRRSIIENLYSTNQLNCDFKFNETQDSRKGKLKLLLFKER